MRSLLLFLAFFPAAVFAQDQSAIADAEAACGPKTTNFAVSADHAHPNPHPDPDKALVFIIEDLGQCVDCEDYGFAGHGSHGYWGPIATDVYGAITKVGLDGSWIGANQGNSYLFTTLDAGEHHLCLNWQSQMEERSRAFVMAGFTAEAGRVYYFRARLFPGYADYSFDLDPVNPDEGKFLVASSVHSLSRIKK